MAEFFSMGGYALFVWASYAIGVGSLIALAVASWWSLKMREAELKRLQAMLGDRQSVVRASGREGIHLDP